MDPMVLRAMAKWPAVPDVYDWLSLDRRGVWRLRGEAISHRGATAFINRNYGGDQYGRWFFQNGPQRVFVRLEYTPLVLVADAAGNLACHTGAPVRRPHLALLDDEGNLLLVGDFGVGLVLDRDLPVLAERLVDGTGRCADVTALAAVASGADASLALRWGSERIPMMAIERRAVVTRYGFVADPRPL